MDVLCYESCSLCDKGRTIDQTISAGIIQISEYWFVYVDLVRSGYSYKPEVCFGYVHTHAKSELIGSKVTDNKSVSTTHVSLYLVDSKAVYSPVHDSRLTYRHVWLFALSG